MKRLLWIALTLAACGKSSNGTTGSSPPSPAGPPASAPGATAAAGPQDRCEVHVTGSQTVDIIGTKPRGTPSPKVVVGSDYWMTDDELRGAFAMMERMGGDKPSKEEVERKVNEAMKKDPRLYLLTMHCSTDDGSLGLSASNSSRSKDIPFGPHTYVIAEEPKAGEFSGMFSTKQGKYVSYAFAAPGKLEITKFDATGVTATFGFEGVARKGERVTVTGSFDFGCAGQKCK